MKFINEFKEKCEIWNNQRTDDLSAIYNTNNEQLVIQNIKYILVGDNPGDTECNNNEYFLGKAGIVTRLFFERFLVNNFDSEILSLNKTPFSTSTTKKLSDFLKDTDFIASQKYMADLIFKLNQELNVPVIVCGISACRQNKNNSITWHLEDHSNKTYLFTEFFKQLRHNFMGSQKELFFTDHFSRCAIFDKFTIEEYRNKPVNNFFSYASLLSSELFDNTKIKT